MKIVAAVFALGLAVVLGAGRTGESQARKAFVVRNDSEGPTSLELAAAVERMFRHPKAGAIGIASLPFGERDKDGASLKAAYRLIEGALKGFQNR